MNTILIIAFVSLALFVAFFVRRNNKKMKQKSSMATPRQPQLDPVIVLGQVYSAKDIRKMLVDFNIMNEREKIEELAKYNIEKALEKAAESGELDLVRKWQDNPNQQRINNFILGRAASGGHLDIVRFLFNEGANVNGFGALYWASLNGHLDIVKFLVENGANINTGNSNFPLGGASMRGYLDVAKYLVEQGADIHAGNGNSLKLASMFCHREVCDYLVSLGCDPQVVIDDPNEYVKEETKQWAIDFVKARDLANKLENDLQPKTITKTGRIKI
ncbi:ankyrin repeat domain-containing protein [Burkholderia contaminans]|uniref:ankyrin repeat domain-containing protein n=1 Tax=Burkholderia contaminans TaxID=488447 RepID=UPI001588E84D|nr:ankyrin repeat domain-containing protein [Burkholderia contaminans]